jgi:AcrR family transcriptional regulator
MRLYKSHSNNSEHVGYSPLPADFMSGNRFATDARRETEERFLDAAEQMLIDVGYAGLSARRLAEEAGANHGLIHYYFGSMEELCFRVLERFTDRLIARQRAMYEANAPYIEKWREAMHYLDDDRPYQKIWWELQAMSWNRPELRARIAKVHAAWCDAMRDAVGQALERYELGKGEFGTDEWVTMIVALNEGIILERLAGIDRGHEELLGVIDRWLGGMEERARRERPGVADAGREG